MKILILMNKKMLGNRKLHISKSLTCRNLHLIPIFLILALAR